jgi:uncharacterized membrane protein
MSAGSSVACAHCGELLHFKGADTAKVQRTLDELQGKLGANVKVKVRVHSRVTMQRAAACASLVALLVLCLAWELWLAPLRPGGSLVALKALPLAFPLRGIFEGRRYTYQWSSLLILAYFAEGVTRAAAERDVGQACAAAELCLSVVFFAATVAYARMTRAGA